MKNNICSTKIVFGENYMMEQTTSIYRYNTIKAFGENYMTEEKSMKRKYKEGIISHSEYNNWLAQKHGFNTYLEWHKHKLTEMGFKRETEFRDVKAQKKGFKNDSEYRDFLAQEKGFKNHADYMNNHFYKTGKYRPMSENKACSNYLGIHIAERILSKIFENVQRMPNNNVGYDFICNRGYKIDVKTSCLKMDSKTGIKTTFGFKIKHNKIADYFLLLAFDNREDLNPIHMWLIKGEEVIKSDVSSMKLNDRLNFGFSIRGDIIKQISKYELNDKLDKVVACCNVLKEDNNEI